MNTFIQIHKTRNERKFRDLHSKQPKQFWKILNNINKQTDSQHTPNIQDFFEHFKEVNSNANTGQDNLNFEFNTIDNAQLDDSVLNCEITADEIRKMINKCNKSKAASPQDYIYNEYLKSTTDLMLPIYTVYFNKIFDSGVLPDSWLVGTIKPIFKKKGSPLDPQNYRPITILSCLGKLFTAVLNDRINKFLSLNNLLNETQAGFRANYSTTDHVFTLKFLIDKLRAEKKKLFCSFIDFSAAFDNVWRAGLWSKLLKTGISGKLFQIIFNMYQDIKSCVAVHDSVSPFFKSHCGVRQGENLSPILFSIYLNDLENKLSVGNPGIVLEHQGIDFNLYLKLFVLLYADDTIIVSDNQERFQNLLNDFNEYCQAWKLSVNMNKTKIIVFGTNKPNNYKFHLNNLNVEIVKEYKYLGILFSSSGSFLKARKLIASQANKAMHILFTRISNLDLPIDVQLKLFDQTILPILTYNCEVWGIENLDIIEKVHTDYLRRITKSKKSTPLYMLYGELGRFPLEVIIKARVVKYWSNLLLGSPEKITRLCYEYMLSLDINYKWIECIRNTLNSTGNAVIWLQQKMLNLKNIDKIVKRTLCDQFLQKWSGQLTISSKGLNYRLFKTDLKLEPYLTTLPKNLRLDLFRFRTGNHKLPVETGRWRNSLVPYHDRKCTLCSLNEIADEFHYLLKCPFFILKRKKFIKDFYYKRPNILKFSQLLSSESVYELKRLTYMVQCIINHFKN
jgi:hypothetical protein